MGSKYYITTAIDYVNSTPHVGSNIVFTIVVTNAGPTNAAGVLVEDILPGDHVTYVSHTNGTYNSGSGIWDIGALNAGSSTSLLITATVTNLVPFTNIAQVNASDQYDPNSDPDNDDPNEDDQDDAAVDPQVAVVVALPDGW